MTHPREVLNDGIQVLLPVLVPHGFHFRYGGDGTSSGGVSAWSEFIRDERRLELHFRYSLGMVRYHLRNQSASHESYMQELGVWQRCNYPGFSEDSSAAFRGLAHDLAFAGDFVSGDAAVLLSAAAKELVISDENNRQLMVGAVGDRRRRQEMRARFYEGRFDELIALADELKYPDEMSSSERRMLELAREKLNRRKS